MSTRAIACALSMVAGLVVCGIAGSADSTDASQWASVGRTSDEQRFSPLTQINEQTLSFIPKLLFIVLALFAVGPWMLKTLVDFTHDLYSSIPTVVG